MYAYIKIILTFDSAVGLLTYVNNFIGPFSVNTALYDKLSKSLERTNILP